MVARYHAAQRDVATVVELIGGVPQSTAPLAVAMLNGIAEGWPQESAPTFSAEQRSALAAAASGASPELTAAFGRVSARWALPNVFTPQ
jgi:hypothetical protein